MAGNYLPSKTSNVKFTKNIIVPYAVLCRYVARSYTIDYRQYNGYRKKLKTNSSLWRIGCDCGCSCRPTLVWFAKLSSVENWDTRRIVHRGIQQDSSYFSRRPEKPASDAWKCCAASSTAPIVAANLACPFLKRTLLVWLFTVLILSSSLVNTQAMGRVAKWSVFTEVVPFIVRGKVWRYQWGHEFKRKFQE